MSRRDGNPATPDPANILTDLFYSKITRPIMLSDNTVRDGEQASEVAYTMEEKLAIVRVLDEIGVHMMNIGFPAVSAAEKQMVKEIVALKLKARQTALARSTKSDVDQVLDCGLSWVTLFVGTSDSHLFDKLRMTEEKALAQVEEIIPYARSCGLHVLFACEDATRTPLRRLLRFIQAAEDLGAETITVPDTVGILTPLATYRLFSLLRPFVGVQLGCHFHNDMGMATGNSISALEGGADLIDSTLLGIGERTGNAPLEELAVAMQVKLGLDLGLKLDLLPKAAMLVSRAANVEIPKCKPIVGEHAFSHESGIHVHGILRNPQCYQPFPPAILGRSHRIIYGKHSGLAAIQRLLSQIGIELSAALQQELLSRIKETAQNKQRVSERQVVEWARELSGQPAVSGSAG